jgi:hypothetical protein
MTDEDKFENDLEGSGLCVFRTIEYWLSGVNIGTEFSERGTEAMKQATSDLWYEWGDITLTNSVCNRLWFIIPLLSLILCVGCAPFTADDILGASSAFSQSICWISNRRFSGNQTKQTLWLLVLKETIPIERPPLSSEISATFPDSGVLGDQLNGFPRSLTSVY